MPSKDLHFKSGQAATYPVDQHAGCPSWGSSKNEWKASTASLSLSQAQGWSMCPVRRGSDNPCRGKDAPNPSGHCNLARPMWLNSCCLKQQFTSRLENGSNKNINGTQPDRWFSVKKRLCIWRNGGKIFISIERETLSSSPTHFSEVTNQWFLFITIGGKNKNPEIYEQCYLFIIQKLFSYHMVGKFTERQSERKLPA